MTFRAVIAISAATTMHSTRGGQEKPQSQMTPTSKQER